MRSTHAIRHQLIEWLNQVRRAPAPHRLSAARNLEALLRKDVFQTIDGQVEIFAREGIEIDRSTLAYWVGQSGHLLAPLVEAY